jgi:ABC-type multidrug transport system permease subunit
MHESPPERRYYPLYELTVARFREFFREPAAVFWVYGFPLLLAVVLGIAFQNRPVEHIRVDISTAAGPSAAEAYREQLAGDARFDVRVGSDEETRNRMRTAKTDLVILPDPAGGTRSYLLDPSRPECLLARNAVDNALLRASIPNAPPVPKEVTIEEPGGRYIDFLIPGLIGTNLMGGGLWGVGFVTVDMRVRKLLKRFLATPMRRQDFLISLMLSRLVFTLIEIALLLGFAYVAFDIHVRGNPAAFLALVVVGGVCFAGLGLLVACRAKTIETVSGLMNAVMMPMYLFSGVFFSSERFPDWSQPVIKLLPLTQLNDGLRAVMNDGAGFEAIVVPLVNLAVWSVISYVLALRFFRWR